MKTRWTGAGLLLLLVGAAGCELRPGPAEKEGEPPLFEPVATGRIATDGGATRGVAWGDFDGDGDPDLYTANMAGQWNALYRNLLRGARSDGRPRREGDDPGSVERPEADPATGHPGFLKLTDPTFSPYAETVRHGGESQGVSWVDYDGDGDLDLFVVNREQERDFLFRNEGDRGFVRVRDSGLTEREAGASMACWTDVDGDGWLDVFVIRHDGAPNGLFRNLGGGRFRELAESPLTSGRGEGRACGWADATGNGRPDLYLANNTDAPNRYFHNLGGWRFREVAEGHAVEAIGYSYGVSWADYDADGDLDLFVANFDRENVLYRNDGRGSLTPDTGSLLSTDPGGASKGHAWGDYDLDGDLDLFVANGTYRPDMRNFLYLNRGDGTFRRDTRGRVTTHADTSAGAAWADYDRDGDLDLFVASWGSSDEVNRLYRNTAADATDRSWVAFRLRGEAPNTFAVGARVELVTRMGGVRRVLRRWNRPVTGFGSQNEHLIHFGLGGARRADSVVIRWPSGREDVHTEVAPRTLWVAEEGSARLLADTRTPDPDTSTSTMER